MVNCPICGKLVKAAHINAHIDSQCESHVEVQVQSPGAQSNNGAAGKPLKVSNFFQSPSLKRTAVTVPDSTAPLRSPAAVTDSDAFRQMSTSAGARRTSEDTTSTEPLESSFETGTKRSFEGDRPVQRTSESFDAAAPARQSPKRLKTANAFEQAAPLAERMRPRSLDEVCGQDLVGPSGILRSLIEQDRVPSMILWGGPGTGKTTIARLISNMVGSRFVEINSTSSGVAECKKIFADARAELGLTGRKTIFFCDEIHRFSKSQQDVFLGPVESGQVTLIGATTENPSFKVQNPLLSRCRTFVLQKLTDQDIITIMMRALDREGQNYARSPLVDTELVRYLAAFSDGDARTALNLLELAMGLSARPGMTKEGIKRSLTKTLVYDRAGDQHYDTISAFHKSIRGGDPDAALYYLHRMVMSGEDPLYIARRLIVVASEDIGLADNSMLSLATAAYTAAEKIGMPEAEINLAHAAVALALSKKSTRAYRGLKNASAALEAPGVAGLPVPVHLKNAPTRLMKEIGYGKDYKYNPNYKDGKVAQEVGSSSLRLVVHALSILVVCLTFRSSIYLRPSVA